MNLRGHPAWTCSECRAFCSFIYTGQSPQVPGAMSTGDSPSAPPPPLAIDSARAPSPAHSQSSLASYHERNAHLRVDPRASATVFSSAGPFPLKFRCRQKLLRSSYLSNSSAFTSTLPLPPPRALSLSLPQTQPPPGQAFFYTLPADKIRPHLSGRCAGAAVPVRLRPPRTASGRLCARRLCGTFCERHTVRDCTPYTADWLLCCGMLLRLLTVALRTDRSSASSLQAPAPEQAPRPFAQSSQFGIMVRSAARLTTYRAKPVAVPRRVLTLACPAAAAASASARRELGRKRIWPERRTDLQRELQVHPAGVGGVEPLGRQLDGRRQR